MPVLETRDLSKTYNPERIPVHALRSVSLTIDRAEFTALVGPSGSGKTTLLNILGGLDVPSSGQVRVRETDLFSLSERERTQFRLHHIGFVFQSFNLVPVLTALENVAFILQLQGASRAMCVERAGHMLDLVGLSDKRDKRPAELSGGQQQRVAVARALAAEPDFVLADEPTANLDSVSAGTLLDVMQRLNEDSGTTFVFSTHDARVVERARRVITLVDGQIAQDDVRS
jgi:putative ABC transport system ATP-binding protein